MKKLLFIVNPRSGKAQIKWHLMDVIDLFNKYGWNVQVHITQAQRDATEIVCKKGADMDMIVCSGGDGTLSETIAGLVQLDAPPLLGYIPAGSTNDFATSLGISSDPMEAAQNIMNGESGPIDIGYFCKEKTFVYVAGFGAFTEVSYQTPQEKKNLLGHQAYVLEGVKSLSNIKSCRMRVEADELCVEGDFLFGMVTNTISVGGFKGLVPLDVALNDGVFEVLLIRMPKTVKELRNIVSNMLLKEETNEYVYKFKTTKLKITSEESVDWVLDGEFGGSRKEIYVENLTKRIEIVSSIVKKS